MTAPSRAGLSPLLDQLDEAPLMSPAVARVVIRDLTAAVRAVAAWHKPTDPDDDGTRYCDEDGRTWPCPTYKDATAALTPGADTAGATA